ncbi:MAG: hypothetical protein ACK4WC_09325 [Rubrimonas sp.]
MADRDRIIGEDYVADPRERRLRVIAQLVDKLGSVLLVGLAFAFAAGFPGWLIPGYRPSGWFVLGLWIGLSIMARLAILGFLARFRARHGLTAPGARTD